MWRDQSHKTVYHNNILEAEEDWTFLNCSKTNFMTKNGILDKLFIRLLCHNRHNMLWSYVLKLPVVYIPYWECNVV